MNDACKLNKSCKLYWRGDATTSKGCRAIQRAQVTEPTTAKAKKKNWTSHSLFIMSHSTLLKVDNDLCEIILMWRKGNPTPYVTVRNECLSRSYLRPHWVRGWTAPAGSWYASHFHVVTSHRSNCASSLQGEYLPDQTRIKVSLLLICMYVFSIYIFKRVVQLKQNLVLKNRGEKHSGGVGSGEEPVA